MSGRVAHHLFDRIFGKPLAVSRQCLDVTLAVLAPRLGIVSPLGAAPTTPEDPKRRGAVAPEGGIARIQVLGRLVQRAGISPDSGDMTSYSELGGDLDEALEDDNVSGILLDIDSPGGEVAGMFDLAEKIAGATKPVYCCANEGAYSGAYALAAACDRIYVARSGGVGSIGVYMLHCDRSGADAEAGLSYTFIYAGSKKIDGNAHAPLAPGAHADLQDDTDELYDMFVGLVADNRGLTQKAVRATEAGTYMGEAAVQAGLADEVGSLEDAAAGLRAEIKRRMTMELKARMAAAVGLPEASSEADVALAIEGALVEKKALGEKAEAALSELAQVKAELAKIAADAGAREIEHVVTLAKTRAIEAGLEPLPKDVEQDARDMLALGKPELAKRVLERHLEGARAKVTALRDPAARIQKDEDPSKLSKEGAMAKAKKNAEALVNAGKPAGKSK